MATQHARVLDMLIRVAAFIIFAVTIYRYSYIPARTQNVYIDFVSVAHNALRAASDGFPLMAYAPETPPRLMPLNRISNGYYDAGMPTLVSLGATLGRTIWGNNFVIDDRIIYQVVFVFCLLTA